MGCLRWATKKIGDAGKKTNRRLAPGGRRKGSVCNKSNAGGGLRGKTKTLARLVQTTKSREAQPEKKNRSEPRVVEPKNGPNQLVGSGDVSKDPLWFPQTTSSTGGASPRTKNVSGPEGGDLTLPQTEKQNR